MRGKGNEARREIKLKEEIEEVDRRCREEQHQPPTSTPFPPSLPLNKFHWHLVNFYFCGAAAAAFLAAGPICRPAARCLGGGGGVCECVCVKEREGERKGGVKGRKTHAHIQGGIKHYWVGMFAGL